jgi:hypothetical protein
MTSSDEPADGLPMKTNQGMPMSSTTPRHSSPHRSAPIREPSLSHARAVDVLEAVGRALCEAPALPPALAVFLRERDRAFLARAAEEASPLVESLVHASALDAPALEQRVLWIEMGMMRAALALRTAPIPIGPPRWD